MICLEVEHLYKQFADKQVVRDISFNLQQRTATALIGANGAGKTTTLSMLAGLMTPTTGSVRMPNIQDPRQAIGFLPQYPQFYSWMTALEYVEMVAQLSGVEKRKAKQKSQKILEFTGLATHMHKKIGTFSGGMKQRLGISQAIVHEPKLLLLDEPVSALDPVGRRDIMNLLKEIQEDTTLLYSTHILNDAEQMTDQLLFLHDGQLIEQGTLEQVRAKYDAPRYELHFANEQHALQFIQQCGFEATANHTTVFIDINQAQPTMQQLLQYLAEQQLDVTKVAYDTMNLEQLFMKVVGAYATI